MISIIKNNYIGLASFLFLLINVFFIYNEIYYFCLFPLVLLVIYFTVFKLEYLFLLVVFCTPLSFNLEALSTGEFGLYIPTEPILLMLMFLYLFKIIYNKNNNLNTYWRHPISFLILLQLAWIFLTSISSEFPLISFKFLLSRLWFVIPIFFLGIHFFKKGIDHIYTFLWVFLIPLTIILIYTLINHASNGFSEEAGHWVMWPFFKDHTSYGAVLAMFFPPAIALLMKKNRPAITRVLLVTSTFVLTIGIVFSFTRAAWVSLVGVAALFAAMRMGFKFKQLFL